MAENRLIYGILIDVLGEPKKKNEAKQQYAFDCPTCSAEKGEDDGDGKGNLEVNLAEGLYHCWSCGGVNNTKGGLKKLFKSFANKNQIKKLKMIGYDLSSFKAKVQDQNVIEDLRLPKGFIGFNEGNPKAISHKQALNYLVKQRKLTTQIIDKHKMGYVIEGKYDSRIVIPSYDVNGELNYWVTRTYINSKPKYLNPDSDKEQIIFNECCLNWDSDIYLVEGPFDHLVVHNSIPILGKKISDKLMNSLFHKASANIIILLDSDAWGDAKKHYSKLNVGKLFDRIKIIKIKEDYDIAKIHEDFGREGVIKVMKSAYKLKEYEL
jgi:DNA primase|tara:strand:- start:178 stop:1143 length:966 start_codon:yes stop_codon:yes gene_type:complete